MADSPDLKLPQGVVELREDIPLKPGAGGTRACAGPRVIVAAFAALSVAVTLALLTQIYYGDYEVVPHGSVSSSAAACSAAGAAALRAGGRAADAAAAAALCLAVLAPHRTSPDASGSMVYWEYRSARTQPPSVVEWEGEEGEGAPPRLLAALAAVHARLGALPWAQVLQPAVDLARNGFEVSAGLASAAGGAPGFTAGALRTEPELADYLESLQHNTSAELCEAWSCDTRVRWGAGTSVEAGGRRVWAGGAGGARAAVALAAAAPWPGNTTAEDAYSRVVSSLQQQAREGAWPGGVASGLAVVDTLDTYAALVTGLSQPFGSGARGRDAPAGPLDLAPAIVVDPLVCGTRYVVGAESGAALAQGLARALAGAGAVDAVEAPRVLVVAGGQLLPEPQVTTPGAAAGPALYLVQQRGDALLSHADSRGGSLASRF